MQRLDLVANPARLAEIVRAAGSALTVDLPGRSLPELIHELHQIPASAIVGVAVPVRDLPVPAGSPPASALVQPLGDELFEAVRLDTFAAFLLKHPELGAEST